MRLLARVALKLYHRSAGVLRAREAALQEGRTLASIRHPNVATVFGVAEQDGRVGIWMELVEGPSLRKIVRDHGPLSVMQCLSVGASLANALRTIHRRGLVHRDIKADNVFLDAGDRAMNDRYVLGDFGLALHADDPQSQSATARGAVGTPLYMAPEVIRGQTSNPKSDLYAVGVLLFFIATGEFPFEAGNLESLRQRHDASTRVQWPKKTKRPPRRYRLLVDRLLNADASRRMDSAEELEAACHALQSNRTNPVLSVASSLLFLTVLGSSLFFVVPNQNNLVSEAPVGPTMPFLTADLVNHTTDETLDGIQALVAAELAQSDRFEPVEQEALEAALARMTLPADAEIDPDLARELGWRIGVSRVLSMELHERGYGYRLVVNLDDVSEFGRSPRRVRSQSFDAADRYELYDTVDEASQWIRETMGEPHESVLERDVGVRETTTPSWEALDVFLDARNEITGRNYKRGLALLQRALEIDPDFTMAYTLAGDVMFNMGRSEGYAFYAKALESAKRRPLSHRENLRVRALIAADLWRNDEAVELYREYEELYPRDFYARFGRAMVLREQGRNQLAFSKFKQAARLDPDNYHMPWQLAKTALIMGDAELVPPYTKRLETLGFWELAEVLNGARYMVEANMVEAAASFRAVRTSSRPEWRSRGFTLEAHWAGELGEFADAMRILEEGLLYDRTQDLPPTHEAEKRLHIAFLSFANGEFERARTEALSSIELENGPRRARIAGSLLARLGAFEEVEALISRLEGVTAADGTGSRLYELAVATLRGELLMERGLLEEGLSELERARDLEPAYEYSEYLGRAYVKADRLPEALAIYERIALQPGKIWRDEPGRLLPYPGFLADGLQRYIRLAEDLGLPEKVEAGKARESLQRGLSPKAQKPFG